jgi:glycosyltransferase involved in cell wall biosynthesis
VTPGRQVVVAIPAYNAAAIIDATLESLEAQTDHAFCVLVSDNASTDGTASVVEAFARRSRIPVTLVHHDVSLGRLGNWTFCLEHAQAERAEWLKWLFAGDQLAPGAIADLRTLAAEHGDVGLIVTDYQVEDHGTRARRRALPGAARLTPAQALEQFALAGNWFGAPLGQMYHRRGFEDAEIGDLGWVADCRLALEASRRHPVLYAPIDVGVFDSAHRRYHGATRGTVAAVAEECIVRHRAVDMLRALDPLVEADRLHAAVDRSVARDVVACLTDADLVELSRERGLRRWARATLRAIAGRGPRG